MSASGVGLQRATAHDLLLIRALEQADQARAYVTPNSEEEHARNLADPRFVYLRIVDEAGFAGFVILVLGEAASVELRRIVVASPGRGTGRAAITLVEAFCVEQLGPVRIWLDVFEDNQRARHVYAKLGYTTFGERVSAGRALLLLEKQIG